MANSKENLMRDAFTRHALVLDRMQEVLSDVEEGGAVLLAALQAGHRLFICGNGGSAADAQHFAAEWTCRYKDDRPPLPAMALTTDTSALTAIGNDYMFEDIFARQIRALGAKGDVLAVFTTSGQSTNILKALATARELGLRTVALTGARGEGLRQLADLAIVVPSDETARIQEMHELIYHAWCEWIDAQNA